MITCKHSLVLDFHPQSHNMLVNWETRRWKGFKVLWHSVWKTPRTCESWYHVARLIFVHIRQEMDPHIHSNILLAQVCRRVHVCVCEWEWLGVSGCEGSSMCSCMSGWWFRGLKMFCVACWFVPATKMNLCMYHHNACSHLHVSMSVPADQNVWVQLHGYIDGSICSLSVADSWEV